MSDAIKSVPAIHYTLSSISAYLAANVSEVPGINSQVEFEKLWQEVVKALKGTLTSPEAAQLASDALKNAEGAEVTPRAHEMQTLEGGSTPRAWLPFVERIFKPAHLAVIRTDLMEFLADEDEDCGKWYASLPKSAPKIGKLKAGKTTLELSLISGNARVAESVLTLAQFTAQHNVSFAIQHGIATVKAGTKGLGVISSNGDTRSIPLGENGKPGKASAFFKDEKAIAKFAFNCRHFASLSGAVKRSLVISVAGEIVNCDVQDTAARSHAVMIASVFPDLMGVEAHLKANNIHSEETAMIIGLAQTRAKELKAAKLKDAQNALKTS